MLTDPRPKVQLPGDDRLMSDTAADLGVHLHDVPIFVRNDEVVVVSGNAVRRISAQSFCSWPERHVMFCKWKKKVSVVSRLPRYKPANCWLQGISMNTCARCVAFIPCTSL